MTYTKVTGVWPALFCSCLLLLSSGSALAWYSSPRGHCRSAFHCLAQLWNFADPLLIATSPRWGVAALRGETVLPRKCHHSSCSENRRAPSGESGRSSPSARISRIITLHHDGKCNFGPTVIGALMINQRLSYSRILRYL